MNNKYFQVTVKIKREDAKGKLKTATERHLVEALTVTEAEARVVKFMEQFQEEYMISSAIESRIIQLITPSETPDAYGKQ
jgi:sulfur relay (sulfurtransferase) DsrC/TusE family protein